jgi:hypothetical protein
MDMLNGLSKVTVALDAAARRWDFVSSRTAGGLLDRSLNIDRHSMPALWLPASLCALLILGSPTPWRIGAALIAAAIAATLLAAFMRHSARHGWPLRADLAFQVVVVLAAGACAWIWRPETYTETGTYRHLLVALVGAMAIALAVGASIIEPLFRPLRQVSQYAACLRRTELFSAGGPAPVVTPGGIVTALLTVPVRAPLALLTPPAIAALVVPPAWLVPVTATVFLVCLLALFVAGLNDRFGAMWSLAQTVLFRGGALVVSMLVIVLAILRLAGFTYATTVLDSAAWWTLGVVLVALYVVCWWYDYWTQRLLADQILALIDPQALGRAGTSYPIDPECVSTRVPAAGRDIQVHGASRLIALHTGGGGPYFQSHDLLGLVDRLATSGAPGGKALPPPIQVAGRVTDFHIVVALAFMALVAVAGWQLNRGEQQAQVTLGSEDSPGLALPQLLMRASTEASPLIVVAASGGGTRAAIHTAAVLEGITALGHAKQIVLGSGVSGGGAALAYFAGHHPSLVDGNARAWQRYFDAMSEPYIQDVMARATEWRMVSSGRLGMLLQESFDTRWRLPDKRKTLGDVRDLGLILNTSLAGHFERPADAPAGVPLVRVEPEFRESHTKSTLAGGRLLLTNLVLPPELTSQPLEPGNPPRLPIIVRNPQLRLVEAAALNANFPPVFANAAIDIAEQRRYWVTDGGAVDNRGMEMLLYALRLALAELPDDKLPELHVVVADASALSEGFAQDRGLSSMAGAGTRYASHLNAELVSSIRQRYARSKTHFNLTYVMMPDLLRKSGSFGTHWMLQGTIEVRHGEETAKLSGADVVGMLRALHRTGRIEGLEESACQVLRWSVDDAAHRHAWSGLVSALGGEPAPPTCAK